jgi:methylated-DNA-[protein]-cysteine S-methyltransferase
MPDEIRYTIFKTKWGYFGLAGTGRGLLRTCLPLSDRKKAKTQLLTGLDAPQYDKELFKVTQEQIIAYFEGSYVDFNKDIPILLEGLSPFCCSVLGACRDTKFGQTISYGELAKKVGSAGAASPVRNATKWHKPQKGKMKTSNGARAVGRVLAKNPLPLIIPCHRVVSSPCLRRGKLVPAQAGIGGFSATGGVSLKKRLLELERQAHTD